MRNADNFILVTQYFPSNIRNALLKITDYDKINTHEIRLRCGRAVSLVSYGKEQFLSNDGGLTMIDNNAIKVQEEDVDYCFKAICDYSIHSYERELSQGFITIRGGNRIGICGTAVVKSSHIDTIKYISGLNFRISGQVKGCAEEVYNKLCSLSPKGILVIGEPGSGKTTFLRDLCRIMSGRWKVSVIDERSEIAAVYHGRPQNDIGARCDVFDGYPKEEGIETAVRVMNPDVIVCDEIGNKDDVKALRHTINSGVKIVASAHAGSKDELYRRRHLRKLIESGGFDFIVTLGNGSELGKVKAIDAC